MESWHVVRDDSLTLLDDLEALLSQSVVVEYSAEAPTGPRSETERLRLDFIALRRDNPPTRDDYEPSALRAALGLLTQAEELEDDALYDDIQDYVYRMENIRDGLDREPEPPVIQVQAPAPAVPTQKERATVAYTTAKDLYASCPRLIKPQIQAVLNAALSAADIRNLAQEQDVEDADSKIDGFSTVLAYLGRVIQSFAQIPQPKMLLDMEGYGTQEELEALQSALAQITITNIPHYNITSGFSRAAERAAHAISSVPILKDEVREVCSATHDSGSYLSGKEQGQLQELLTALDPRALGKQKYDMLRNQLLQLLQKYHARIAKSKEKEARKLKNKATPDGDFYRNPSQATLLNLFTAGSIGLGNFKSNYRALSDGLFGYSISISVVGMNAYEIHVHCDADGSIAGGASPVHIKPIGQKYDTSASVTINNAMLLTGLLPSQAVRSGWKPA